MPSRLRRRVWNEVLTEKYRTRKSCGLVEVDQSYGFTKVKEAQRIFYNRYISPQNSICKRPPLL